MYPLLKWRTTRYELTTRRMRLRTGVVARNGSDIPLSRITDVSFRKSLLDRLLGCGTLIVESAGGTPRSSSPGPARGTSVGHAVPAGGGRAAAGDGKHSGRPALRPALSEAVRSASVTETVDSSLPDVGALRDRVERGGAAKYHESAAASGKMFARDRIALIADAGSFTEDGRFANVLADGLPADGVVTGTATLDGRPVAIMANDSTVKAGSWGARTVEKIIRIIERALDLGIPMIYLVDSAGARITDQVEMFPGRRGAGRIFHTQVRASGVIPQVCALFGPSAAGGAYIPPFCDFVAMVEGNASMYLGSPRMVEMVVSEKTTLEELGGARMHCSVSGSGYYLAKTEDEALAAVPALPLLPPHELGIGAAAAPGGRQTTGCAPTSAAWCRRRRQVFDMRKFIRALADPDPFFEVHALWAREVTGGFARLDGPGDRGRRQQPALQGRGALRRLGRQGGPVHRDLRRVRRAAALPGGRARVHGRHRG